MDIVVRVPRIPAPGETVMGGHYRSFAGGKGANQAVAARRFGADVSMIACVGDDAHAAKLRDALTVERIDGRGVVTREKSTSGLAMVTVTEAGENAIAVAPGANAELTPEIVQQHAHLIREADVLLMQLEIPTSAVQAATQIAGEAGKPVILNVAPARTLPRELLAKIDVIVLNRTEAANLLQVDASQDPARTALRLPDLGVATAVMTLGAQGGLLLHRGRPRRYPTIPVKALDAVGAGDAFCGVLACGWARAAPAVKARATDELALVEQAVVAASAAGALATTRAGAIASMPSRDEVLDASRALKLT